MVDECPQEFIDFAEKLADAARPVIHLHFRTPITVDAKVDNSPVTIADRDAEAAMRALIADNYSDHGILGEEFGSENLDAEFVWVLDPIDGTRSFITGRPIFGTLIALVKNGVPVLGVIDQAILDERWIGAAGRNTVFNGKPIHTRPCPDLGSAILGTTSPDLFDPGEAPAFRRLAAQTDTTIYGGDCYGYALLASGFSDLVVEAGLKPYDFCALVPVIAGAGGVVTDWHGNQITMASNGRILAVGDPEILTKALTLLADAG
jgi:inositol-phosphate phosphatase / L-galactose 1-phosphate phosphatase / histidinol-phosphatase